MKIDITKYKGDPYVAVCETIREMTRDKNGYEDMPDRLVRIKTSVLGEDNVLLTSDSDNCYWDTDWYEGGDVELLGFINIDDIPVPTLEQLKWKYPRIKEAMKEKTEPTSVSVLDYDEWNSERYIKCPACACEWSMYNDSEIHFCPNCGKPVKMEMKERK